MREAQASHRGISQPSVVPLIRRVEPVTWVTLGRNLIDTYNWIKEQPSGKLSSRIDLDVHRPESDSTQQESAVMETDEAMASAEEEVVANEVEMEETDAEPVAPEEEPPAEGEKSAPEEVETENGTKSEASKESSSIKRKRSTEAQPNPPITEVRDPQRRSTRSRACTQRTEEDIYSLRAELRSYLPTALL